MGRGDSEPAASSRRASADRTPIFSRLLASLLSALTALVVAATSYVADRATRPVVPTKRLSANQIHLQTRKRLLWFLGVAVFVFAVAGAKMIYLQVVQRDRFIAYSVTQREHTTLLAADRGTIFDRNGIDLALSAPSNTIVVDPTLVKDKGRAASLLAPILGLPRREILTRLKAKNHFQYLARQVDTSVVEKVKALDPEASKNKTLYSLGGIYFVNEPKRVNPSGGNLASPVLGSVNLEGAALSGLEASNDSILKGKRGRISAQTDSRGREIPSTSRSVIPAKRGDDLVLTIDQSLQYEVERRLVDRVAAAGALGGLVVVADITNGDILAMASAVGADAAKGEPARVANGLEQNRPLTWTYTPGSVNKIVTFAGAIERSKINADSVIDGITNSVTDSGFTITDDHVMPSAMSATEILARSSNVGTTKVAAMLGKEGLSHYLTAFGYGVTTSIDFPAQSSGILAASKDWRSIDMLTKPIGYGLAATPMQVLDAYMTIANGGKIVHPRLVAARIDSQGVRHPNVSRPGGRVVSRATASAVTEMLTHVVAPSPATGGSAAVPGYTVAGKTGTARQKTGNGADSFALAKLEATFVGFAPAENPRFAAIVVLDGQAGNVGFYGGSESGPLFSQVMAQTLRLNGVAPTRDPQGLSQAVTGPLLSGIAAAPTGPAVGPPSAPVKAPVKAPVNASDSKAVKSTLQRPKHRRVSSRRAAEANKARSTQSKPLL